MPLNTKRSFAASYWKVEVEHVGEAGTVEVAELRGARAQAQHDRLVRRQKLPGVSHDLVVEDVGGAGRAADHRCLQDRIAQRRVEIAGRHRHRRLPGGQRPQHGRLADGLPDQEDGAPLGTLGLVAGRHRRMLLHGHFARQRVELGAVRPEIQQRQLRVLLPAELRHGLAPDLRVIGIVVDERDGLVDPRRIELHGVVPPTFACTLAGGFTTPSIKTNRRPQQMR
jgi:hypothetical protein